VLAHERAHLAQDRLAPRDDGAVHAACAHERAHDGPDALEGALARDDLGRGTGVVIALVARSRARLFWESVQGTGAAAADGRRRRGRLERLALALPPSAVSREAHVLVDADVHLVLEDGRQLTLERLGDLGAQEGELGRERRQRSELGEVERAHRRAARVGLGGVGRGGSRGGRGKSGRGRGCRVARAGRRCRRAVVGVLDLLADLERAVPFAVLDELLDALDGDPDLLDGAHGLVDALEPSAAGLGAQDLKAVLRRCADAALARLERRLELSDLGEGGLALGVQPLEVGQGGEEGRRAQADLAHEVRLDDGRVVRELVLQDLVGGEVVERVRAETRDRVEGGRGGRRRGGGSCRVRQARGRVGRQLDALGDEVERARVGEVERRVEEDLGHVVEGREDLARDGRREGGRAGQPRLPHAEADARIGVAVEVVAVARASRLGRVAAVSVSGEAALALPALKVARDLGEVGVELGAGDLAQVGDVDGRGLAAALGDRFDAGRGFGEGAGRGEGGREGRELGGEVRAGRGEGREGRQQAARGVRLCEDGRDGCTAG